MKRFAQSSIGRNIMLFSVLIPFLVTVTGCGEMTPQLAVELPEKYNTPDGMVVGHDKSIYISCNNWNDPNYAAKILRLDESDALSEYYTLPVHPDTGKANPLGIDIGPDGNFYIADNQAPYSNDYKSRLLRIFTDNGRPVRCEVVATGFILTNGVACTEEYVYVAESTLEAGASPMPSGVYRFTYDEFESGTVELKPGGEDEHLVVSLMTRNPDWPVGANGIDTDRRGNLFVGNFGDAELMRFRFNQEGQVTSREVFAKNKGMESIDGLKVHPRSGDIYIADFLGNAVHKVDRRSGKVTTLAKNKNTTGEEGLLDGPSEVCFRGNRLYVSNIDLTAGENVYDVPHTISVLEMGPARPATLPDAYGKLVTPWAEQVMAENVWPEYPRPQLVRGEWKNLNGAWDYAVRPKWEDEPEDFDGTILVPFCIESALSGVQKRVNHNQRLWYRRRFEVPGDWRGRRVRLNFGAVDWEATVWVNGAEVGSHKGGYDPFSFDITQALRGGGVQEIVVSVWDPTDRGFQPRGKQVTRPGGIWYTAVTGIWQTVWLEPVNEAYIESLRIVPDIDEDSVQVTARCSEGAGDLRVEIDIEKNGMAVAEAVTRPGVSTDISIRNPELWSPDNPFLYDLRVTLKDGSGRVVDEVSSYFGMRKICLGRDRRGLTRLMLNNEFVFQFGFLDQGWWPDGLYTAPTDEALRYDVEKTKEMGFNLARKHVKSEPNRWYYWCDRLGLLVWQDMPSGDDYIDPSAADIERSEESAKQFMVELERMIERLYNHPSIIIWVPYNEGWGQWATEKVTKTIKAWDPSRLVISASGWADRGTGDVHDIHSYPGPAMPEPEADRAIVLGEFGGLGLPLRGHTWQDERNWGYRSYKNTDELTAAYRRLIRNLMPMVTRGLSAAVYTQTTDVEIEVNGLMTYDREVVKIDMDTLRRINGGYCPPAIESEDEKFLDSGEIRIFNPVRGGEIRYTLDGSEPDKESALYMKAITVDETTTVKARTFWPDGTASEVSEYTCEKVSLRRGKDIGGLEQGLRVTYYESDKTWDKLPSFWLLQKSGVAILETCDLKYAEHSERENNFGLVFEGFIKVPADGIYTFYSNSDDGSRLYVDSVEVVDNDYSHPMSEKSGMIALKAGTYPFKLEYFQGRGGKGLEVSIKGPNIEKQPIPKEMFYFK